MIKALLFFGLGVLSLLWFGYEAVSFLSRRGMPTEDNAIISLTLTGLKLVMAIMFFVSGINSLRRKD